jgi:hypothetical protein
MFQPSANFHLSIILFGFIALTPNEKGEKKFAEGAVKIL